jgi:hypothetical protein
MSAHAKQTAHPTLTGLLDLGAALLLPIVEWLDDLTRWERTFQLIRAGLLLIVAIAAITALAACGPDGSTSTTTNPSAVKIATGMADAR